MHDSFPWIQLFGHQARDEQKSWISVEGLVDLRKDSVLGKASAPATLSQSMDLPLLLRP